MADELASVKKSLKVLKVVVAVVIVVLVLIIFMPNYVLSNQVRAYVVFSCTADEAGNANADLTNRLIHKQTCVASVLKLGDGIYRITFSRKLGTDKYVMLGSTSHEAATTHQSGCEITAKVMTHEYADVYVSDATNNTKQNPPMCSVCVVY